MITSVKLWRQKTSGANTSRVARVPKVAAATRPTIILAWRPTAERAPNARGGIKAFLPIKVAIRDDGLAIFDGAHARLAYLGLALSQRLQSCAREFENSKVEVRSISCFLAGCGYQSGRKRLVPLESKARHVTNDCR
jgi:hypothetical protein